MYRVKFIFTVIGGGKDLAAAASIVETRGNKVKQEPDIKPESDLKMGQMPMGSYHPKMGGMHPSPYDMMRTPQCKYYLHFLIRYINRYLYVTDYLGGYIVKVVQSLLIHIK